MYFCRGSRSEGRDVDRLLADDGAEDDLGGGQGAHAYTSSIRARAGCSMRTTSALQQVDDVERVGEDHLDRRQVAGRQLELLVAAGGDDEDPAVGLERAEDADEVAGLDRLEAERVDDLDRLVAELRGERAAEREPLHLARQALLVGPRVRPEHGAAAAVVGRACGSPGGRGRCPSGGTASRRRRGPRRGSSCRACPIRRPASWAVTTWWRTAALTGAANSASASSTLPTDLPVRS